MGSAGPPARADAPTHAPARHALHQHNQRKDQRDSREGFRSQPADKVGLTGVDGGLGKHHGDVWRGEAQQRRRDWCLYTTWKVVAKNSGMDEDKAVRLEKGR